MQTQTKDNTGTSASRQCAILRAIDVKVSVETAAHQLSRALYQLETQNLNKETLVQLVVDNLRRQADALQSVEDFSHCLLNPEDPAVIEPEWIDDLATEMMDIRRIFRQKARDFDIDLDIKIYTALPQVKWDMHRLRTQVFNHLISAAILAAPVGSSLTFSIYAAPDKVVMGFKDNLPESDSVNPESDRVNNVVHTDRFIKPEPPMLSARSCIEAHGGELKVSRVDERGIWYLVELPLNAG